jgi:hypothetical protein
MSSALFETVKLLERARIHYSLQRTRPDTICVSATFVGERVEIDVFEDNHIEISRFYGTEAIEGEMELLLQLIKAEKANEPN